MDGTNSEQDFVTSQVNVSDSAPILNLNQNQNSVYHDLRNNAIDEGLLRITNKSFICLNLV